MSEEADSSSSISQRSKRRRVDKKASAFERLREAKAGGNKNKWAAEESSKIYDEIDEDEYTKLVSNRASDWIVDDDGEGYVEDGREIFDDAEDEYEVRGNSNKRKSNQKKRGIKLPDEPVSNKKSLKNFFSTKDSKEKGSASVDDDLLLKNILGELSSSTADGSSSSSCATIALKPIRSIKKTATESEIEMKNYMAKFEKANKTKKNNEDEIIEKLLKDERKQKKNKENFASEQNTCLIDKPVALEAEILEPIKVKTIARDEELDSLLADEIDFPMEEFDKVEVEKVLEKVVVVQSPEQKPSAKSLASKPGGNFDSSIFKELDGIDFEREFEDCEKGLVDFDTESMKFYFIDAWTDVNNRPGEVYLFGKVEIPATNGKFSYESICVRVENVNRHLYLLPRQNKYDFKTKTETEEEVNMGDVYQEFEERLLKEINLTSFSSRKVSKSFAFTVPDVDVPMESDYLEVLYAGKYPTPNPKNTYATIAHIFGANTSPIETLLLESKIKGPCWLEIKNYKKIDPKTSWTKNQISCPDMNCVQVIEGQQNSPPPLTVLTVNVKCILHPSTHRNEIVQISCLVNEKFHLDRPVQQLVTRQYCGITRPSNKNWPFDMQATLGKFNKFTIAKVDNERALLSWFLSIYDKLDPDVVVNFDSNDCQLDIICNRVTFLKIPNWSRIGRLKINQIPGKRITEFFIGRLICDVKLSATELIKSRTYDLGSLCKKILKIGDDERQEIIYDNIPYAYDSSSSIIEFVEINVQDCIYISKLMAELNILPLALQITNIAGNLMSRTLQGGRSERNEFLLMHAFYEKSYIVPDKKLWKDDNEEGGAGKKKAAYAGGLVLEPIKGLYESFILLMDFNSLYPSIIQEYNICYTTIAPTNDSDKLPVPPDDTVELGILPRQIRRLVESRRSVKALMNKPNLAADRKMQYNIRQMALKLTANSMYGCLGFSKSRFYAPHLAALVTCKGRDILMLTKSLVERMNHNVIYGDTDSIMINTNSQDYEEVYKIGTNIKKAVNVVYKNIELDIDGVYKKLLLLKKKKYAAVVVNQKPDGKLDYSYEFKGLDIVRRDWSKIASKTGTLVLDILLSDSGKEMEERIECIFDVLSGLGKDLQEEKIPLAMLEITKQLTKAPSEYVDMTSLPHVQVADRMNTQKNRRFKKGDMIDYIICEDGTDNSAVKRGYHIDEVKGDDKKLKVDKVYYLSQQIHPVICRLLEPIEGIDAALIAEKLGLDPKEFRNKTKIIKSDEDFSDHFKSNMNKYRYCEKFHFPCAVCKSINFVAAPLKRDESSKSPVSFFDKCSNNNCDAKPVDYLPLIRNHLRIAITKAINRFYENWFVCDNPMCNINTQSIAWPCDGTSNIPCLVCMEGNLQRVYTNEELNTQLKYYTFMFNANAIESSKANLVVTTKKAYDLMLSTVESYIDNSKYFKIELKNKFQHYDIQQAEDKLKVEWKKFFVDSFAK